MLVDGDSINVPCTVMINGGNNVVGGERTTYTAHPNVRCYGFRKTLPLIVNNIL